MKRYICIHGHFYQPPRENPWLEAIETQRSAYPYHDWNARVTAECYSQNGASRILDEKGLIERIVNNYARISFDFGPTLLSWMEENAPAAYRSILDADAESRERFGGHGSAMAQAYNHIILPLASARDKETQILWGIRDFERRFSRPPEGMWLPETAVDLESLDLMAAAGIGFTILSPGQARRVRPLGSNAWEDVRGGGPDPTRAYVQDLPSGRKIAVFFYNGPVARAVAFERLLHDGAVFASRLAAGFSGAGGRDQLVHIATDGESYGHHHRFGDMALAKALAIIEEQSLAELTNYAAFLEKNPPAHEVEILESTSWSCPHGVDRWRADCGCATGGNQGYRQAWRAPLRAALDWLRDETGALYERNAGDLLADPWKARNRYIDVILDRSPDNVEKVLKEESCRDLRPDEKIVSLKMLEMQRHAMLMYTSCGWFFDEISGIETVQVIAYAARTAQLARETFGVDLEPRFLDMLAAAPSNLPEQGNGRKIYEEQVRPTMLEIGSVGAHYAVSSLFRDYPDRAQIYCYDAERLTETTRASGRVKLAVGRAEIRSQITQESSVISYAALHLGDHNITGGAREYMGEEAYEDLVRSLAEAFSRAEIPEVIRLLDAHFGRNTFSLRSLFRDEQRRLLRLLLEETTEDADAAYRQVYRRHAPIMQYLAGLGMPIPRALQVAAERAVNKELERQLEKEDMDPDAVRRLLTEAKERSVPLDGQTLEFTLRETIETLAGRFEEDPSQEETLEALHVATEVAASMPFRVDLWQLQNAYYKAMQDILPAFRRDAGSKVPGAGKWVEGFLSLGSKLRVKVG